MKELFLSSSFKDVASDLTAEQAAERLRGLSEVHYKAQ